MRFSLHYTYQRKFKKRGYLMTNFTIEYLGEIETELENILQF
jgi:hypothetical protein